MPSEEYPDCPEPDYVDNAEAVPDDGIACIIAGSRSALDLVSEESLCRIVDELLDSIIDDIGVVISGTANGVDEAGEAFAARHDIAVAGFSAPWNNLDHPDAVIETNQYGKYNARAGPIRNEWMAQYATMHPGRAILVTLLDYPSSGTESMIEKGREYLGDENVFVHPLSEISDADAYGNLRPVLVSMSSNR